MDKNKIINLVSSEIDYTLEQKNIIAAIEEARIELNNARQYFDTVNEPNLIDYAIYMEQAAKAKYAFLLAEARRHGITANYSYMFQDVDAV